MSKTAVFIILSLYISCLFCLSCAKHGFNAIKEEQKTIDVGKETHSVDNENGITDTPIEMNQKSVLKIFCVPESDYQKIMASPSINGLYKGSYETYYVRQSTATMEYRMDSDKEYQFIPDGVWRIAADATKPLYKAVVEFATDYEQISSFIGMNGKDVKVSESAMIYCFGYPLTIWVQTEVDDYYIAVEENSHPFSSDPAVEHEYTLYTKNDYVQLILPNSIIINVCGKNVDSYAFLRGEVLEIPIMSVLNALEVENIWSEKDSTLTIESADGYYVLNTEESSFQKDGKGRNLILTPPGGYTFLSCTEDDIFVDEYTFKTVMECIGRSINYNLKNNKIIVK